MWALKGGVTAWRLAGYPWRHSGLRGDSSRPASAAPGTVTAGPVTREVPLVDGVLTMPCVVETDTLVIALEDARTTPLPTGTAADPKRHHVSRVIEALRVLARTRASALSLTTDPLFGVIVIGGPDVPEPHRTTILEGLPHIEREQAEAGAEVGGSGCMYGVHVTYDSGAARILPDGDLVQLRA